jgi:hypothetical protein
MGWLVKFADTSVSLDDLPGEAFARAAAGEKDDAGQQVTWYEASTSPGVTQTVLYRVICEAAAFAGVPAPKVPGSLRDVKALLEMLALVTEDDRPKVGTNEDSPSTEDDPATTS